MSVERDRDKIRLRWRHQSQRQAVTLFSFNRSNFIRARKIALALEADLLSGTFDTTLIKYGLNYRDNSSPKNAIDEMQSQALTRIHSITYRETLTPQITGPFSTAAKSLIAIFEEWTLNIKNRDCEKHKNYNAVRNMFRRWAPFQASEILIKLNAVQANERTYNRRLTMLKDFTKWLVKQKIIDTNYLEDVQPKQIKKVIDTKRKPFTPLYQLQQGFDVITQLKRMEMFQNYALTEAQFAHLLGRCRMYSFLPAKQRRKVPALEFTDTHLNAVCRDYYKDQSFCRDTNGNINLWRLYNLFTAANKSSYIDSFASRAVNASLFVSSIALAFASGQDNWFLC